MKTNSTPATEKTALLQPTTHQRPGPTTPTPQQPTQKPQHKYAASTGATPLTSSQNNHLHSQQTPSSTQSAPSSVPYSASSSIRASPPVVSPSVPSDSEWEECVVLKDGKRYPVAEHEKHITTWALFAIIYFCVTGGPYGLEDGVRAAAGAAGEGVGWVIILLIILPLLVHFPIALLTSEFASAMPQNGGYILWVSRAFGNFWGFQEGWFSWCSATVDTALYPFLIIAYANTLLQQLGFAALSNSLWFIAHTAVTVLIAILNLTNQQLVGAPSLLLSIIFLCPFFLITLYGISSLEFSPTLISQLLSFPPLSHLDWGLTLSAILWVGAGWDSVGTVGNDVKRPKLTYPRAIVLAMIAVTLTNSLPILVAVLIDTEYEQYDAMSGFWVQIAEMVGGSWLAWLVMFTSIVGNLHLFNVLFTSSSWSLFALCLPGLLDVPAFLRLHHSYETPVWGIVASTLAVIVCGLYTFDGLLQLAMAFNALALLLQCFSLIHLRVSEPMMRRPYSIQLSTPFLALFLSSPILISVMLLLTIDPLCQIIVVVGVIVGAVSFYVARWAETERLREKERQSLTTSGQTSVSSGDLSARGVHPISGLSSLASMSPSNAAEYDGFMSAPVQPAQVNLQAMFEDVAEDAALVTGYRTSAQVESLPDFIAPIVNAPSITARGLFSSPTQPLTLHQEGEEHEATEAEEDGSEEGVDDDPASHRIRFASLRVSTPKFHAEVASAEVPDSPIRPPSPVLLRSPKDGRRSISNNNTSSSTHTNTPATTATGKGAGGYGSTTNKRRRATRLHNPGVVFR